MCGETILESYFRPPIRRDLTVLTMHTATIPNAIHVHHTQPATLCSVLSAGWLWLCTTIQQSPVKVKLMLQAGLEIF